VLLAPCSLLPGAAPRPSCCQESASSTTASSRCRCLIAVAAAAAISAYVSRCWVLGAGVLRLLLPGWATRPGHI
jgi:hypothetical protein